MMNKHNFYAGPSILPQYTIDKVVEAVKNFAGTGLSVMEVSHRSKEFVAVMEEAQLLLKELLSVPDGYHVLFLGGGASTQFAMVPMNILKPTSRWSSSQGPDRAAGNWRPPFPRYTTNLKEEPWRGMPNSRPFRSGIYH